MRSLSEPELASEGEKVGRSLPPRSVLWLEGDLGAGKTTFIRAIARGLGARTDATSPTFSLVHRYDGHRGPVFHLDCYRLKRPEEAEDLDLGGLLAEGDAMLVEWPERARGWLPDATMRFRLHHLPDSDLRGLEQL